MGSKKQIAKMISPLGININNKIDMFVIVEIAGQQFKVEKGAKLYVHRLESEEGSTVDFEKVLLVSNDDDVKVGTPVVAGSKVTATVLAHVKGEKVMVFKKKRRKGYKKKNGHRQQFTQIQIEDILVG